MFFSANDLLDAVSKLLQKGTLADFWKEICDASNQSAYWEIVGRLTARGFSKTQIDEWDRGQEFQRSIGLFWALNHPAAIGPADEYGRENLKYFDRRDELSGNASAGIEAVNITIDGEFQSPENPQGQLVAGPMDTSDDLFVPIDPRDKRIGQPTRT